MGLRCEITAETEEQGLRVDLRIKINDANTSMAQPKTLSEQGTATIFVEDDQLEGTSAVIVLLDYKGEVICKQATIIGGED